MQQHCSRLSICTCVILLCKNTVDVQLCSTNKHIYINDSGLFAWISLTALSRLCVRINDPGLFAWISLTCFVSTMCTD